MLVMSVPVEKAPNRAAYVEIGFERGIPTHLDGGKIGGVKLIERLNALGGKHAVGQTDLVENRLVGMKSRGVYETPAGTILYEAHRALESICLERETAHYKEQVALRYAELTYYGQWYSALREALDAFIDKTQEHVTGTVRVKLFKGAARTVGVKSDQSLYREDLASFTMGAEYDAADANGFIRLFALPSTVRSAIQGTGLKVIRRKK
jgi:argininosuccinate synthase